jgi:hypothetical protein
MRITAPLYTSFGSVCVLTHLCWSVFTFTRRRSLLPFLLHRTCASPLDDRLLRISFRFLFSLRMDTGRCG